MMKLSLTQQQIGSLLANAFFCTFPEQGGPHDRFPSINFHSLYSSGRHPSPCKRRIEKLRCLFNYMKRITNEVPLGVVTINRRCLKSSIDWSARTELIPELLHVSGSGTIEDTLGEFLEADFANKYIGGGVLGHGMVQEEIRFSICPELIVTRLVAECLGDREALHVKGFERFSDYTGYANTCEWVDDHVDSRPMGEDRRRQSHLVAMDALNFSNWREQFSDLNINRELHKALIAFGDELPQARRAQHQRAAVATGNWGCGAFKGDVRLKFLIQLMACSVSGRNMAYFTFGDQKLQQRLLAMHRFLRNKDVCVGGVYAALMAFIDHLKSDSLGGWQYSGDSAHDLFQFVEKYILDGPTAPPPPKPPASKKEILQAKRRQQANEKKQERLQNQSEQSGLEESSAPEPTEEHSQPAESEQASKADTDQNPAEPNSAGAWLQPKRPHGKRRQQNQNQKGPNNPAKKSGSPLASGGDNVDDLCSNLNNLRISHTPSATSVSASNVTPAGCSKNMPKGDPKRAKKHFRRSMNKKSKSKRK